VLFAPLAACGDASVEQPPTGSLEQALVGAPARRTRTIAAMMFDIGQGPPDQAKIQTLLTGDTQSLRHMYNEISFGMQDLSVDMLGPYTLPQPTCLPIECCGPKPSQPNGPEVAALMPCCPKSVTTSGSRITACTANCGVGRRDPPTNLPCTLNYSFVSRLVTTRRIRHNFGMTHEPFMNYGSKTLLDDTTHC
jgi:hypothetical protein